MADLRGAQAQNVGKPDVRKFERDALYHFRSEYKKKENQNDQYNPLGQFASDAAARAREIFEKNGGDENAAIRDANLEIRDRLEKLGENIHLLLGNYNREASRFWGDKDKALYDLGESVYEELKGMNISMNDVKRVRAAIDYYNRAQSPEYRVNPELVLKALAYYKQKSSSLPPRPAGSMEGLEWMIKK